MEKKATTASSEAPSNSTTRMSACSNDPPGTFSRAAATMPAEPSTPW